MNGQNKLEWYMALSWKSLSGDTTLAILFCKGFLN